MSSPSDNNTGATSRRLPLLLALAAGTLVVTLFFVLLRTSIPDDRERAAAAKTHSAFELALEDVRIRDVYDLTSARFQPEISFEAFKDSIDRHPIVKGRPMTHHWSKGGNEPEHKSGSHEFTYQTVVTSDEHVLKYTCVIVVERGGRGSIA